MNKLLLFSVWLIISLMVAIGYMYKGDLTDFGNLFMANLFPGRPVQEEGGVIEVAGGQGGHFFIETQLDGVPVRFLVDTGASAICITREIAVSAGIDVSKLVFNQVFQTANGASRGASAKIKTLKIGDFEVHDLYVSVSENGLGTPLLGMAFLSRLKSYTFKRGSLYLHF